MLFTDTVTVFNKIGDGWKKTIVKGVQWSDEYERENVSGRISVARYGKITFPKGTYEGLTLEPGHDEDAIFFGEIQEDPIDVRGYRISDMVSKYPRSGIIKAVNDNSNRTYLQNVKVVVG